MEQQSIVTQISYDTILTAGVIQLLGHPSGTKVREQGQVVLAQSNPTGKVSRLPQESGEHKIQYRELGRNRDPGAHGLLELGIVPRRHCLPVSFHLKGNTKFECF